MPYARAQTIAGIAAAASWPVAIACGADERSGPASWVEFDAVPNVVTTCDGTLTSWTVTMRGTATSGTGDCAQPILFTNLVPFETYTFDISAFSRTHLCWEGACVVKALIGSTVADCSAYVDDLCAKADAGGP